MFRTQRTSCRVVEGGPIEYMGRGGVRETHARLSVIGREIRLAFILPSQSSADCTNLGKFSVISHVFQKLNTDSAKLAKNQGGLLQLPLRGFRTFQPTWSVC